MKTNARILTFAILALAPAAGWAAPGDGLATTAHDFSGKGAVQTGLCTFCHTPHKAITTQLLWNHTLSTNTFAWDIPSTTAGTNFPSFVGNLYVGPSAKCLSCHDGSVAVGDIAWFNEGKPVGLDNTIHGASDPMNVGFGGAMKGNHPVAMPYPYLGAPNTYNGTTTGAQFTSSEWQPTPVLPIRMFNQDASGAISAGVAAGRTGMECSSCHDPHNKAAVDDLFLRGKLGGTAVAGSTDYICLKCHIK
jgi:cytochrome c553